jgi:hypothetical protein
MRDAKRLKTSTAQTTEALHSQYLNTAPAVVFELCYSAAARLAGDGAQVKT